MSPVKIRCGVPESFWYYALMISAVFIDSFEPRSSALAFVLHASLVVYWANRIEEDATRLQEEAS